MADPPPPLPDLPPRRSAAPDPDAERRLAVALVAAEATLMNGSTRRWTGASLLAAASSLLVLIGLLLPWAWVDPLASPVTANAFAISRTLGLRWIAVIVVALALVSTLAVAARRSSDRTSTTIVGSTLVVGGILLLAALPITLANRDEWPISSGFAVGAFAVALGAIGLIAAGVVGLRQDPITAEQQLLPRPADRDGSPLDRASVDQLATAIMSRLPADDEPATGARLRIALTAAAAAALVIAATATLAPWVRFRFPDPVWQGGIRTHHQSAVLQAAALGAARPALIAAAAAVLVLAAVAALPALRRFVAPVAAAGGVVLCGLAARAIATIPSSGFGTSVRVDVGPTVVIVAAAGAVLAGLASSALTWTEARAADARTGAMPAVAAVLVVVALVAALVAPISDVADPPEVGPYEWVLGATAHGSQQLGIPATEADMAASGRGAPLGTVAVALDGSATTSTLQERMGGSHILSAMGGRIVPRTTLVTLSGVTRTKLVGTVGQRAIVLLEHREQSAVVSIDLRYPRVNVIDALMADDAASEDHREGVGYRVLLEGSRDDGSIVDVTPQADGAVIVRIDNLGYRVPAATVRSGRPWTLETPLALAGSINSSPFAADGTVYRVGRDAAVVRTEPDGDETKVFGGSTNERCGVSSDPTSSFYGSIQAMAVDRRGALWFGGVAQGPDGSNARPSTSNLLVLDPDGTLRVSPVELGPITGIAAAPDGSVTVKEATEPGAARVLRVPDAAPRSRTFPLAPAPSASCRRTSTSTLETAGAEVEVLRRDLPDGVLYRSDGTVATYSSGQQGVPDEGESLVSTAPDGSERVLQEAPASWPLVADGQGGLWAVNHETGDATTTLQHFGADGRDGSWTSAQGIGVGATNDLSADPDTGELVGQGLQGSWWSTTGPTTRQLPIVTDLRGSPGFTRSDQSFAVDGGALREFDAAGQSTVWLGGSSDALPLDEALASGAAPERTSPYGVIGLDDAGRPLLYENGVLARVEEPGEITALAGPAEGLPPFLDSVLLTGDSLYGLSNGRLLRVRLP